MDPDFERKRGRSEMKALIWIGCKLGYSLIMTGLASGGIIMGALPTMALFGGTFFLARYLCKKYEESQINKFRTARSEDDLTAHSDMPQQETTPDKDTSTPPILYCRKCGGLLTEDSKTCSRCGRHW